MLSRFMVLLLLVAAVASTGIAAAVVAHQHRDKHNTWSELQQVQKQLFLNQQRLQIELSVWSQPVRIEEVARQQLQLRDSVQQHLIVMPAAAASFERAVDN